MTEDPPKRRTLSLKPGVQVTRPLGPQPLAPLRTDKPRPFRSPRPPKESKPVERPSHGWKCKPCGAFFDPPAEGPDDEVVRCPGCNARIGVAGDFRQTSPPTRLRARPMRH
jgi:DNA-directed RNA polymerase subunit RPC12/RpoP